MIYKEAFNCLYIAILYSTNLLLCHAASFTKDVNNNERRDLNDEDDAAPLFSDDTTSLITGSINIDSMQPIITQQKGRSSDALSFSLNVLDLNGENDDSTVILSFDCKVGDEDSSDTSILQCSNQEQRRRHLNDQSSSSSSPPPLANAFIGTNNEGMVTGLIESNSVRYEIRSRIERHEDGTYSNLVYSYAAAKSSDLYYHHKGIAPKKSEGVVDDSIEEEGDRKLDESQNISMRSNIVRPFSMSNAITNSANIMNKRELSDDGSEIDLLIYYTYRGACQWLEESYPCTIDSAAMSVLNNYAETWVQYMNSIMVTSDIADLSFVKVHLAVDPDYDEGTSPSTSGVLYDLTYQNDGELEQVHQLRNEYSADLVVGFMYVPGCGTNCVRSSGVGWVPDKFPSPTNGFSVTGGNHPFLYNTGVHEVGHNLGCNHHRDQEGGGTSDYNYGYADCSPSQCWTTIMSYRSVCSCSNVERIGYFSNPNVLYNGIPTGTSNDNNALQVSVAKEGVAINRMRGQLSIDPVEGSYWTTVRQIFVFDVIAKSEDITITNCMIGMEGGTDQVEFAFSRSPYDGNVFDDSFWEVVADEVISPLSETNPDKLENVGFFSSPFAITVPAGGQVSIRMKFPSGGGQLVSTPGGNAIGDIGNENDDLALTVGRMGSLSSLSSSGGRLKTSMMYTVGSPSLCADNEDQVTITVQTDDKGNEIYWFLKQYRANTDKFFNIAKSGRGVLEDNTLYTENYCVKKNKCFKFVIKDTTSKDGLCCDHGEGYWQVHQNGERLKFRKMIDVKKQTYQWGSC